MRRYSPSTTELWTTCPLKRRLRVAGWKPRRLGKRELSGILGTGFAAGLCAYNASRQTGSVDPAICAGVGIQSIRQQLQEALAAGATIHDTDHAQYARMEERVQKGIEKYVANDPLPPAWAVLDVELTLPEWGGCRLDLGLDTPQGPVVLDYKCRTTQDAKYLQRDTERWRLSEQRFHYSCAYGDYLNRPVYAFYICLVVLEPSFRTHLIPFVNHPEELQMWRRARETVTWPQMEREDAGELGVGVAAKHDDAYGLCEYVGACFTHRLTPELAQAEYITPIGDAA